MTLLVVAVAAGLSIAVYPRYAPRQGWRVNPAFRKSGGIVMTIGMASMIGGAILIVASGAPAWQIVVSLTAAILLSVIILHVLKSAVQTITFALVALVWAWFLLMAVA